MTVFRTVREQSPVVIRDGLRIPVRVAGAQGPQGDPGEAAGPATQFSELTGAPGDNAALAAALALKAPLASPTLTGTPAAPTAAGGTNTTQIATTAFVQAATAALINAAPGALDTLDELAAALGDDANFAATVTTALAGKQASSANLTTYAGIAPSANVQSLLGSADYAAMRTNLGMLRLVAIFFTTTPTASEVLGLYIAADAFTIPANMAGSQVSVGTNPTATFAVDVQKNGSTIGTISISTGGVATLTTTSGTSKSIAAGDILKFVAPGSADATCANVAINLKGAL